MNIRRQMIRWQLRAGKITEAIYAASFKHPPAVREFNRLGQGYPIGRIITYERRYHPTKGWRTTRA